MSTIRILCRLLLCAVVCSLTAACSNDDSDATTAVEFKIAVDAVEAYTATVTITHNGTNRDTFYGFIADGRINDVQAEIRKMLASDRKANVLASALNQRKRVLTVTGLRPKQEYTYIVFGMDSDGNLYGTPGSAVFSTAISPVVASETSNWSVTCDGHVVYSGFDYTQIHVVLEGEVEERYFLYVCEPAVPATYDDVEDFIVFAVDEFTESHQASVDDDFWLDNSAIRTGSTFFYRYLQPGDYIAYAIGLKEDGTPTGTYAKSEVFHVDKYPYVDTYADLLNNDWYFEDSNGRKYYVAFQERIVNYSLTMTGWGYYDELPIIVLYDRSDGALTIKYQVVTAGDVTMDFSSGSKTGTVYLAGAYYNLDGKLTLTRQSHKIAVGTLSESGGYSFDAGFYVTLSDDTRAENLGMSFIMRKGSTDLVAFGRMMFPFTLKKME